MTTIDPTRHASIVTRGLRLSYGKFEALRGIDMEVTNCRITALIGPSGCGKSTLLRCFNRINERFDYVTTSGEVLIHGHNIYDPEVDLVELRKQVGMVFQRPNPLPISVRDNVLYGYRLHTPGRQRRRDVEDAEVESALKAVRLWDAMKDQLDRKATTLQLEAQQKLCIARLMPLKPSVLLMDEPCSTLDPDATSAVEDLMRALAEQFTIVVVTHNMAQARRVSDECVYMLLGEIVEHRRTEQLFIAPRDKRTADYIEGRFG
ncbi:MAG TPA: phosphate ABC transporter ATP-binding protein [Candidatus Limnocylindrales bacterium]|nr:phosphate ABC transporter ATP-binding protein [Candidatus Limnocylindrales bacterium]